MNNLLTNFSIKAKIWIPIWTLGLLLIVIVFFYVSGEKLGSQAESKRIEISQLLAQLTELNHTIDLYLASDKSLQEAIEAIDDVTRSLPPGSSTMNSHLSNAKGKIEQHHQITGDIQTLTVTTKERLTTTFDRAKKGVEITIGIVIDDRNALSDTQLKGPLGATNYMKQGFHLQELLSEFKYNADYYEELRFFTGEAIKAAEKNVRRLAGTPFAKGPQLGLEDLSYINNNVEKIYRNVLKLDILTEEIGSELYAMEVFFADQQSSTLAEVIASLTQYLVTIVIVVAVMGLFIITVSWITAKSITIPLIELKIAAEQLSLGEGDLTQRLNVTGKDEIAELSSSFNLFLDKIHIIMCQITEIAAQLNDVAGTLEVQAQATSTGIDKQQTDTLRIASSVDQMASKVQEITKNANVTATSAQNAQVSSEEGMIDITKTSDMLNTFNQDLMGIADVIKKMEDSSNQIGSILEVIRSISEQTNLLALNAAIEAARAGEQGRGFAVVADEVRGLAQRTRQSTEEIQGMIETLQVTSNDAMKAMSSGVEKSEQATQRFIHTRERLQHINEQIVDISNMNLQVAAAVEQQGDVTSELQGYTVNIRDVSESIVSASAGTRDTVVSIREMIKQLDSEVGKFKL